MPGAQHMRDEGTRTVTAGKAGTAMETTKLGAFAHGDKTGTRDPQESHRAAQHTTTTAHYVAHTLVRMLSR